MIGGAVNIDSWIKREHYKSDSKNSSEHINQNNVFNRF
jgi:hypothetical protein